MEKKIIRYLLAIMLIITLAGLDLMLLGHRIILAIYEEGNLIFHANFEKEQASISQTENLSINILIQDSGILENGKIKIKDGNFVIDKDKITDERIKSVHPEGKEIELNQIIGESKGILLPIKFHKEGLNHSNYFEKINTIQLTGQYRQESNYKEIEEETQIKLMWTEQAEINLHQEIEKYINLGENGILLQQKIVLETVNNILPVENQKLEVKINEIEGQMPYKYVVLHNGKKQKESGYKIDEENKTITINYQQNNDDVQWGNGIHEYKIIYTYPKEVGYPKRIFNLETNTITKLYTKDEIEKIQVQQQEVDLTGNEISLYKVTTPYIYKGYLYANIENETQYNEKITMEVSSTDVNEKITLKESNAFLDEQDIKYSVKTRIAYKQIQINKENMVHILGTEGKIELQSEDGTIINTIDPNTQADESGNIVYSIENGIENLIIVTTGAKEEGNLEIYIQKSISGKTEYTKQQLKNFIYLEDTTQLENNLETEIKSEKVELKDTKTEAKLEVNSTEWSTLQENTNVQMIVTLKSDCNEYDLWKDPYLYLKLPNGIEHIKVNSITPFNSDNFRCKSAGLNEEEKIIKIELEGEQTEFKNLNNEMQLIISCDITMSKVVASRNGKNTIKL